LRDIEKVKIEELLNNKDIDILLERYEEYKKGQQITNSETNSQPPIDWKKNFQKLAEKYGKFSEANYSLRIKLETQQRAANHEITVLKSNLTEFEKKISEQETYEKELKYKLDRKNNQIAKLHKELGESKKSYESMAEQYEEAKQAEADLRRIFQEFTIKNHKNEKKLRQIQKKHETRLQKQNPSLAEIPSEIEESSSSVWQTWNNF
jgi:chromosome segregation ATPase